MITLRPRGTSHDCCYQDPHPHGEPLLTNTSAGDPPTLADEETASKRQEVNCPMATQFRSHSFLERTLLVSTGYHDSPWNQVLALTYCVGVTSSIEGSSHFARWEINTSKRCSSSLINREMQMNTKDFPGGSDGKASVYHAGDQGSIPGLGRSSGEGNGNPLQYYCLENPMDRGAW